MKIQNYITRILEKLRGLSGMNFQIAVGEVLKVVHKKQGKKYEMPSHFGGDHKNDGWVVDDALFYQIYAPRDLKFSLKKDIENKFKEDLEGLVNLIIEKKEWGGCIKSFIFIVNTRDDNLPADPNRYFKNVEADINRKYSLSIDTQVVNLDFIREILEDNIYEESEYIKIIAGINAPVGNINNITEGDMVSLIDKLSAKLIKNYIYPQKNDSDYSRISTPEKISINELDELRDEIERYMNMINTVDSCLAHLNDDITNTIEVELVIDYIIELYKSLSKENRGIVLLNKLFEEIYSLCCEKESEVDSIKLLIIYIFDKCDIFEKN